MNIKIDKCKKCGDNYFLDDLIWGDKGNFYLICQECFNFEQKVSA